VAAPGEITGFMRSRFHYLRVACSMVNVAL
jgi:hypothetical protein